MGKVECRFSAGIPDHYRLQWKLYRLALCPRRTMLLNKFIFLFFASKKLSLLTAFLCWRADDDDDDYQLPQSGKSSSEADEEDLPHQTCRGSHLQARPVESENEDILSDENSKSDARPGSISPKDCDEVKELMAAGSRAGVRVRIETDLSAARVPAAAGLRREGVLLDAACAGADRVLQQVLTPSMTASESRAFHYRHTWLVLHNDSSSLGDVLSEAQILPDGDVTWSTPEQLVDVYRVKVGRPLVLTRWAVDRAAAAGLPQYWARQPTTVARRKDLQGVTLPSATIISQPQHFRGWQDLTARQIDTYPKVTYPLMMLLAEDLHFRHNMRQVDLYGVERNGSFDGLAGFLQRRDVELGVASIFMRGDRWRVLDYVAETIVLRCFFIFRQPAQAAVTNVFVLPFSGGVWAAAAGLCAGAALLLAGLGAWARRARDHGDQADPALLLVTPGEAYTFAIGVICQQGFHVTPALVSARLVMYSALLLALFAFTAYSAKIVAILQAPSSALRTIADLERSTIALAVQETTYKKTYFAESNDPATQRLYRRKLLPLGERAYMSVVDGIARVRTEFFAFQVEESAGYDVVIRTFTEREKCALQEVPAFTLPMVAVPIRKLSGYRELLAARLRWQRETGLMSRERHIWMASRPRCDAGAGGFASVSIQDVLPCVQVLAIGALLSTVFLAAECFVHRLKRR
ncbi:ionotropic receptor 75a-like [Pectinophora gossypiella]|uniref:ionotropic receptor 75a-like n=1 Tax=Pectinophora gossypiella TaxID=13191 RepID=UPI00214ED7A5|nr:ionotropic receptor 75a-like [Pectinophora gossypiella]